MAQNKLPIVVLISGGGRTLKNIFNRVDAGTLDVDVKLVVASKPDAGGLKYAEERGVPTEVVQLSDFADEKEFSERIFRTCNLYFAGSNGYVVLAGFLKKLVIPDAYVNRVVNIHPSLIPSFCGDKMYGERVHKAAIQKGVKISGCTVHFANNEYDDGPIILQKWVPVLESDTPHDLADRVLYEAEFDAFPEALQLLAEGRVEVVDGCAKIKPSADSDASTSVRATSCDDPFPRRKKSATPRKRKSIAVLMSRTGRTLKNLLEAIEDGRLDVDIRLVVSSSSTAAGLQYAEAARIPIAIVESGDKTDEEFSRAIFTQCRARNVDYVVMAGYLKRLKIPEDFEYRVVNIHPSLAPAFSEKRLFGRLVHAEAIKKGVKISGCTVHYVDLDPEKFGPIIWQRAVPVKEDYDVDKLSDAVLYDAEFLAYPEALQLLAEDRVEIKRLESGDLIAKIKDA